jgi:hypothetical protein
VVRDTHPAPSAAGAVDSFASAACTFAASGTATASVAPSTVTVALPYCRMYVSITGLPAAVGSATSAAIAP